MEFLCDHLGGRDEAKAPGTPEVDPNEDPTPLIQGVSYVAWLSVLWRLDERHGEAEADARE